MTNQKLYTKLAKIIGEAITVKKSGYNEYHDYKYATEKDVLELVRERFSHFGLLHLTQVTGVEQIDDLTRITLKYTIIDVESGEREDFSWIGDGADKGDKGVYKAYTGAEKYFFMKLLKIAAENDPEADTKLDEEMEDVKLRTSRRFKTNRDKKED